MTEIRHITMVDFAARQNITLNTARYWRAMGYGPWARRTSRGLVFALADVIKWEETGRDLQIK